VTPSPSFRAMQSSDDEAELAVPLAHASSSTDLDDLDTSGLVKPADDRAPPFPPAPAPSGRRRRRNRPNLRPTPRSALVAAFHRAWRVLPASWCERDPDVALRSLSLLAAFVALCVFVFALPNLLSVLSPNALTPPCTSPTLDAGTTVIEGDYGAVAADVGECSKLGVKVLHDMGGNAIDAMVATVLCQGVLAPYASGIGGGAFILVHFAGNETVREQSTCFDARETAPAGVKPSIFVNNETASRLGGLAVAVPGELRGLQAAHTAFGSLPWADLVNPVADLADEALVGPMLARRLLQTNVTILSSPSLAAVFTRPSSHAPSTSPVPSPPAEPGVGDTNVTGVTFRAMFGKNKDPDPRGGHEDLGSALHNASYLSSTQANSTSSGSAAAAASANNETHLPVLVPLLSGLPGAKNASIEDVAATALLRAGDKLVNPALVSLLRAIAYGGADVFYNELAADVAQEVRQAGGLLSEADLRGYQVVRRSPITSYYHGIMVMGAPPPSAGGVSISMALNILEGLDFRRHGRNGKTYLQLTEAIKYVFAARSKLGDPRFVRTVGRTVQRMLSKQAAMAVRSWMESGSGKTFDPVHYAEDGVVRAAQEEHGTSHVSIVDANNNAVSVTSSINLPFGAGFMSTKTGIVFNNQMDDFATSPDRANAYGLKPAPENSIRPGKRPLSSMSPTILLHNNRPYLVVGGSGGPT
jgi:gamma-glutamyltranspeptidase